MEKYNGWTNYATWRINLEIFDGMVLNDFLSDTQVEGAYELGQYLKDYAEELICTDTDEGLCQSYALAFMSDVNWVEIASHFTDAFNEAMQDEERAQDEQAN
jgi:hypothetical protein